MKTKEDALKYIDLDKTLDKIDWGYCKIKLKCGDCPFSDQYNNGQTCRDSIKQYVKYVKKMKMDKIKEIIK